MPKISKNYGDTTFSNVENRQVPLSEKHLSIVINGFKDEAELDFWFKNIETMIKYRKVVDKEKKKANTGRLEH